MSKKVPDLQAEISKELSLYSKEISEEIEKLGKKIANQCKKDIQAKAPVKTGEYKKSWRVKSESDRFFTKYTIYSIQPQLPHLLENGHMLKVNGKVTGKRTRKFPHIKPAEEKAIKDFEDGIERIIKET